MFRVIFGAVALVAMTSLSGLAVAEEATTDTTAAFEVATNEESQAAETAADEDRIVCRRTRVTGSHRVQRVCMSQAQWTAESNQGREAIQHQETLGRNNTDASGQQ